MTRKQLYAKLLDAALRVYDRQEASSVVYFVAEGLCGLTRADFVLDPNTEVEWTSQLEQVVHEIADARPAQYIVGRTEFCGLGLTVSEGVLIPRPETEELVQWIVADVSNGYTSPEPAVLDVGTGSGAIAVVLASLLPLADVGAIDISPVALNIAEANAESNGVDVEFRMADILDPDFVAWTGWSDGAFDIIVSNPPYIPDSDVEAMHGNVTRYEPHEALFVPDNDPLIFYRAIVRLGHKLLKHGGLLYFEIYERAGDDLQRMLAAAGYKDITLRKDINGKDRMIRCRKG